MPQIGMVEKKNLKGNIKVGEHKRLEANGEHLEV